MTSLTSVIISEYYNDQSIYKLLGNYYFLLYLQ